MAAEFGTIEGKNNRKYTAMQQSLEVSILPSFTICFEYKESDTPVDKSTQRVQDLIFNASTSDAGKALFLCGLIHDNVRLSSTLSFWKYFTANFIKELLLSPDTEEKREKIKIPLLPEVIESTLASAPPMVGLDFLNEKLLKKTWKNIHNTFVSEISRHDGTVESLLKKLAPDHDISNRIHFHLVENRKDEKNPFAFMATYSTAIDSLGTVRHISLHYALKEFGDDKKKLLNLLSTVYRAAKNSDLINGLMKSGELFHPIVFNTKDAYLFLKEVPSYEESGILCRIPRWWKGSPRKIAVGLSVGNSSTGRAGAEALLDFSACLHIDGETITGEEAQNMLDRYNGLVFFKGKWIAVDTESLKNTLEIFKKAEALAKKSRITLSEAMQILMGTSGVSEKLGIDNRDILCGSWLKSVLEKMGTPSQIKNIKQGKNVIAVLRPYQQHGLNWLRFLHSFGFGMCLADDMGLGKTVQVLAHLQTLKENHPEEFKTSLLIVPASLLTNWQQEVEKFTPKLQILIAHAQITKKEKLNELSKNTGKWDLIISTYAFARRTEWLSEIDWYYAILDEAQAIKNASTAQTRAIKKIKAKHKLVLTGTPLENRLSDVWSIFDFINPGLLGSLKKFVTFTKTIDEKPEQFSHLRKILHPYLLRRLKTDKSIIADLPDKTEVKCYADLSKEQIVLYRDLVAELDGRLKETDGIQRKGLVLSYLMKFKQLCNHPDQFTGQGGYDNRLGGKFSRLADICETVYEKREKILIFTQFREIIKPLHLFLKSIFNHEGLMLHGQTSVKKRKELVARFQSDEYVPYFVLSLKAAGVGLNLTAANHVVHFDRWWNPAVEDQATDRAFRIGQKKNVLVHKFICKGTIEDKIDSMIEDKKSLSEKLFTGGGNESWITELSNEKLLDIFSLSIK